MNKHLLSLIPLSAVCLICSSCENTSTSGTYSGICHNTTFGGKASLDLSIQVNKNNIVSGYLSITGKDLYGSGSLKGTLNGNRISFNSDGDNDLMTCIQWTGTITDSSIIGTYTVIPTAKAQMLGFPIQNGTFNVSKQ